MTRRAATFANCCFADVVNRGSRLQVRADALRWRVDSDLRDFEAACARQDWARAFVAYGGAFCDGFEHKAAEPFSNGCASSATDSQRRFVQRWGRDCGSWAMPRSASKLRGTGWRSIRWTRTRWPRRSRPSLRRDATAKPDARSSSSASGWRRRSESHRRHACERCWRKSGARRHRRRPPTRGSSVAVPNCGRPMHCCGARNAAC